MRLMLLLATLTAAALAPAHAETVEISGPLGPLAGERITVEGAEHVVVIIPGSGMTDHNGNGPPGGMRSDTYLLLAEGLAARGVASLRVDKRGTFASAGAISDGNDVTIAAYAQDARDWVNEAAGLAPCVWLAGHSEGGLVALAAAQTPPEALCGLILLAAPGRPVGQLLIEQIAANPASAFLLPEVEAAVAEIEAGRSIDPEGLAPPLQPLFTPGVQRYMIDLFSHDPVAVAQWEGPALIVQGDADLQVRPLDAGLLATALPQAERLDLPGGTHMLKPDQPGQPFASYSDPSLPLHAALIPAIVAFLERAPGR